MKNKTRFKFKNALILLSLVPFVLVTFAVKLVCDLIRLPFLTFRDTLAAFVDAAYDYLVCKRGTCERLRSGAEPCHGCEYAPRARAV